MRQSTKGYTYGNVIKNNEYRVLYLKKKAYICPS
jgi:hypothetical protein